MNVYTNNQFTGHWPVGTAAVVVAEDADAAVELLNNELARCGLPRSAKLRDMALIALVPGVEILQAGDY